MLSTTEEIKQRLNLVDLIREYIQLTPAGANFRARCPFHNEKTPSFMVSNEKQIWHCFGCGAGGDHFEFIKKIEGLEFPEALRILADKANVRLDFHNPELHSRKTKTLDLLGEIAGYWHQKLLNDPAAEFVRQYLNGRGVIQPALDEFSLGYAAESWDDAIKHLQNKSFSLLEISQAGLSAVSEKGKPYDRFRGRLMFPIKNVHGHIVGFGARKMKEEDKGGKYINSPQTDIYNKSEVLYNLDQAKTEIKRLDYVILVEGYMDVIACHQAGTKNAVSVSGTALTEGQIKLLKRYTNNVMIAFDADTAGISANLRGIDLAWQAGLNVKVIHLTGGKDPDEIIRQNKDNWREQVAKAENFMDYIFSVTLAELDLTRVDHKKKAAQKLIKVIANLGDEVERAHYLKKLAGAIAVSEDSLKQVLERFKNQNQAAAKRQEKPAAAPAKIFNNEQILLERLITLLLKFPQEIPAVCAQFDPEMAEHQLLKGFYKNLIIHYNKEQSFDLNKFTADLPQEQASLANKFFLLAEIDATEDNPILLKEELVLLTNRLKKKYIADKIKQISQQLPLADKTGNQDEVRRLSEEFSQLTSQLKGM